MRDVKPFERDGDVVKEVPEGIIRLVGWNVDLNESEVLLDVETFTEERFQELFDCKTGEWYVENGWAVGRNPDMCPGMIVSKGDYFGNVMLELTATMVAPSTHDINVMINGEWDDEKGRRNAYVAGLEAFWHGNIGFEKSPDYKLTVATQLLDFDPAEEYQFRLGRIDSKIFVMVNDRLCMEITDPDPIDPEKYGKIGFEAFASWWKFKDLKVYRLKAERIRERYLPEF